MNKQATQVQVGQVLTLLILDLNVHGQGIARHEGLVIFVDDAVPGDMIQARLIQVKPHYAVAVALDYLQISPDRTEPFCRIYSDCGGCNLQHLTYQAACQWKQAHVYHAMVRIAGLDHAQVKAAEQPILGMDHPFDYRNKVQFPVSGQKGDVQIGYYQRGTHAVCDHDVCRVGHPVFDAIREVCRTYLNKYQILPYQESNHTGLVRHILMKRSPVTKELMVYFVLREKTSLPNQSALIERLNIAAASKGYSLKAFGYNIQPQKSNQIIGDQFIHILDDSAIQMELLGIRYRLSPQAFFQINQTQTEQLYQTVLEFAQLTSSDVAMDLYCGTGSITLLLANASKYVYGNEIIPEAVEDAQYNAAQNHIMNVRFDVGRAEQVIDQLKLELIQPQVVVVDPPRKGCDIHLLKTLIEFSPERIIYVSCNPATLARDMKILCDQDKYVLSCYRTVDLFPHTTHVETVVLMSRVK